MLFSALEFVALFTGIALPLMPLNKLYRKGSQTPPPKTRQVFSIYAVDEDGNLVDKS